MAALEHLNKSSIAPVELTILRPCLNENETIAACIQKSRSFIDRTGISAEVLVADNGNTDGSVGRVEPTPLSVALSQLNNLK
jgi:hypothetical protein